MRGFQGLRGSALSLSTSSSSSVRTASAASLLKGDVSAQNLSQLSVRRTQNWNAGLQPQRRWFSISSPRLEQGTAVPTSETVSESAVPQRKRSRARRGPKTDLVYPRKMPIRAPAPEEITSADYVAADSAEGLEEIGGLDGWWDKQGHWPRSKQYSGFGPLKKVTDPALLEVLTKRAVIEAVVLHHFSKKKSELSAALTLTNGEELLGVVETDIVAGPDGAVTLKDEADFQRVWDNLTRALPGDVQEVPKPTKPRIQVEEARKLVKSWGPSWKALQLKDPIVKFYTAKRIQRLTGHRIPDAKLMGFETVRSLISYLIEPPKPKKLADQIETAGILSNLRNVQVVPRRVTPVDKDKAEGRWKIIEAELKKRGLPVFGTAGYRKAVEKSWVGGGV